MSRVSYIIPAFNVSRYIGETLESGLRQKFADIEIIVVNDCSTDNYKEIIESLISVDRILYIIQNTAKGYLQLEKMGEYLASGKPILAHVPFNSFTAWYFHTHQCGAVADKNSSESLAVVIRQLITDEHLRQVYSINARVRARVDFDPAIARSQLLNAISLK